MQTSSSANLTCSASASAVEWTATVLIPSSLHARMTRRAISPRFAIRIFRNTAGGRSGHRPQAEEHLAELHRLPVRHEDVDDLGVHLRLDLVHELHRLDDAQDLALADLGPRLDEGRCGGARLPV